MEMLIVMTSDIPGVRRWTTATPRRRHARALVALMPLLLAGCLSGPQQWGPFRGQVVDAETGRPIAGAHVMVSWDRDIPNLAHATQSFYDAQETVTDANGGFEIPRKRRLVTVLVSEPRVRVFAPDYLAASEEVTPTGGRLYVDPTIVKMRPLKTREERCKHSPGGPGGEEGLRVPRYAEAVLTYVAALDCHWPEGR